MVHLKTCEDFRPCKQTQSVQCNVRIVTNSYDTLSEHVQQTLVIPEEEDVMSIVGMSTPIRMTDYQCGRKKLSSNSSTQCTVTCSTARVNGLELCRHKDFVDEQWI